jgi:hypothetical protein
MTAKHVPSEALKLTPAEHRLQACREGKLDGFPSEDVFRDGRS